MLDWISVPAVSIQAGVARGAQIREGCALMSPSVARAPTDGARGRGQEIRLSAVQRTAVHNYFLTHIPEYR